VFGDNHKAPVASASYFGPSLAFPPMTFSLSAWLLPPARAVFFWLSMVNPHQPLPLATMKRFRSIVPLVIATCFALVASALLTGCNSPSPSSPPVASTNAVQTATVDSNRVARVAATVKLTAQTGAFVALQKKPDIASEFAAAKVGLDAILNDGNFDPAALQKALDDLKVKGPTAYLAVSSAVSIVQVSLGSEIDDQLERTAYLRPVLQALSDGLGAALATVPPPKQ
jgi:hypothetical protein